MPPIAVLDVDGTLVDTNYQHALAWYRAFRAHDVSIAVWRIHRHVGMGGDQLIAALGGDDLERDKGDDIRATEKKFYKELIGEVQPMDGARDLLVDLRERGNRTVLASSAKEEEIDYYLDLLDARKIVDAWTTSADVEATKPKPDLVVAAIEKVGGGEAVMVGDSTFDVEAALRAEVKTLAVLTGGFSEQELMDAGAETVFESVAELRARIDSTLLA